MIKDSGHRRYNGSVNKNGDMRGCQVIHGLSKTRLYSIWCDMKRRCYNPKNKRYKCYGGRNIKVCEAWKDNFVKFYEWSISSGYTEDLTIDRIDVNGDYEPSNCRWVTMKEQQRNTTRSHFVTANGETKTMAEWSEITGIPVNVIKDRLNKLHWSEEEAVTIPTMRKGEKRCQL
jgi:hypothetical protein